MKKLNHILLFEAFDSRILSKTLEYSKNKKEFLDEIKNSVRNLDYPISSLKDEFFEYLPVRAALKKIAVVDDEPCPGKSSELFGEFGIDGESCHDGKIKRKWGKGIRVVICTKCGGTGIKPKTSTDLKLIKFWFDKDGKYLFKSYVDGIVRNTTLNRNTGSLDPDIESYEVVKSITKSELMNLEDGSIVYISLGDYDKIKTVCQIYRQERRESGVYAIQYQRDGSSPSGNEWKSIANKSWLLGGSDHGGGSLLKPLEKPMDEPDPYTWNFIRSGNLKELIKSADFAIILDLGKLRKSDWKSVSDTKKERKDSRSGALSQLTDKEIKDIRIGEYIANISSGIKISRSVSDLNRFVKITIGGRYSIFLILGDTSSTLSDLGYIIDDYIDFIKSGTEDKLVNIDVFVSRVINRNMKKKNNINTSISNIRALIKQGDLSEEKKEKYINLLDLLLDLSELINKRISELDVETISDLEIIYQKIKTIQLIFSRYKIRYCGNLVRDIYRYDDDKYIYTKI